MAAPKLQNPRIFRAAVARKLAGVLHRIWRDGAEFRWGKEVALAA